MNKRFKKYLAFSGISQKEIASLSGLSEMQVSRFCSNGAISVDNLVKLLLACDDLNLEYLFFGYGSILKEDKTTNYIDNSQHGTVGSNSFVMKESAINTNYAALLLEKDKIISQRDATIQRMQELFLELQKAHDQGAAGA